MCRFPIGGIIVRSLAINWGMVLPNMGETLQMVARCGNYFALSILNREKFKMGISKLA